MHANKLANGPFCLLALNHVTLQDYSARNYSGSKIRTTFSEGFNQYAPKAHDSLFPNQIWLIPIKFRVSQIRKRLQQDNNDAKVVVFFLREYDCGV